MSNIVKFDFEARAVRTVMVEGEPWWVAKDVCEVLGLSNVSEATSSLDPDEKTRITEQTPNLTNPEFGMNTVTYVAVSESGLYALIMKSRKPEAKRFRKWVTSEVLPAIRKTGVYVHPQAKDATREALAEIEAAMRIAEIYGLVGNAAVIGATRALKHYSGIDPLEVLGVTHMVQAEQERMLTATEVGMELDLGARDANKALMMAGLQFERRDHKGRLVWEMTDRGKEYGRLFDTIKKHTDGTPVTQLKWRSSVVAEVRRVLGGA